MNIPDEEKMTIKKMIESNDPTLPATLERYKDFKYTSEIQLERTTDPERRKVVQSKIDFYASLIDYIESQEALKKH